MQSAPRDCTLASTAVALLAIAREDIGGLWLRSRSGAARDHLTAMLRDRFPDGRRIPATITEEALLGGLDLGASLGRGEVVMSNGVAGGTDTLVLSGAERCQARLGAHLGQLLDRKSHVLIALDEGAAEEELPPATLTDRLGLFVCLDAGRAQDAAPPLDTRRLAEARNTYGCISLPEVAISALAETAFRLGITSLRAPLLAAAAARANAALHGRANVADLDLEVAVRLCFAHRANVIEIDDERFPESQHEDRAEDDSRNGDRRNQADMLVDTARASLPPDLLAALSRGRAARRAASGGGGQAKRGNRRGRPLPSRPGTPHHGARIDLIGTLRAAAPWQTVRQRAPGMPVAVRREDIRLRRYEEKSDRLVIFVVDASGSHAMARLAEAKGAVEHLLGDAYARRDHVALIGFRGTGAEVLLPPTRSLVRTKRQLTALPGGGGTPLASGLMAALELGPSARRRGMSPALVLLTDGRANVSLDGTGNRARAMEDVETVTRLVRADRMPALVIDTAIRPARELGTLAVQLDATYLALPRADARGLSGAVFSALDS